MMLRPEGSITAVKLVVCLWLMVRAGPEPELLPRWTPSPAADVAAALPGPWPPSLALELSADDLDQEPGGSSSKYSNTNSRSADVSPPTEGARAWTWFNQKSYSY